MKKALLCVIMALLCGCQSLPATAIRANEEAVELTLAIPKDSTELLREVARELSRRAEDFADNSLTIEIVEAENIWQVIERGRADLVVCDNSRAVSDAEALGRIEYPVEYVQPEDKKQEETVVYQTVEGEGAFFAMLEYPYFFRDADCVISGGNDAAVLAALNYSLPEDYGMELKRITYGGTYHWLTNDKAALEEYLLGKSEQDVLAEQLAQGYSLRDVWGVLGDSDAYVREVDLTATKTDLSDKTVFLSGGRMKLIDIFADTEALEKLSDKQRAAVEEAIVYSGGYGKTLAEDQQESVLRQLQEENADLIDVDIESWYSAFQKLYRSGEHEVSGDLAELLWDKTERFH